MKTDGLEQLKKRIEALAQLENIAGKQFGSEEEIVAELQRLGVDDDWARELGAAAWLAAVSQLNHEEEKSNGD